MGVFERVGPAAGEKVEVIGTPSIASEAAARDGRVVTRGAGEV